MQKTIRLALITALWATCSFASVLSVTSAGGLGANDSLDWGQLGADLTTVTGPFSLTSVAGNTVTVSNGTEDFWSIQQDNSWGGNFNPGDNLLFNQATGPVTLAFLTPVMAIGARFQSIDFGAFTIFMTAYDSTNTSLGTFSTGGTSNGDADGSAAFLGVLSSNADIASVVVDVQVASVGNAFALGSLSIAEAVTTPEPSTMLLAFGGVLACLAGKFRARRS